MLCLVTLAALCCAAVGQWRPPTAAARGPAPRAPSPFQQSGGRPAYSGYGGMMTPRSMQSNCNYLKHSKTKPKAPGQQMEYNAGAFKIYTRSRAPKISKGTPVEVTIGPFSSHLSMFNFTSFILYSVPSIPQNVELEYMAGGNPAGKHIGVFQLFREWAAGAGGLSCGLRSTTDDSVAAFEDLIMPPWMPKPARNQVSVLWWPTSEALNFPEIKFKANLHSNGQWFALESTPWQVNRPMDQWRRTENWFSMIGNWAQQMRAWEKRMDQPGSGF